MRIARTQNSDSFRVELPLATAANATNFLPDSSPSPANENRSVTSKGPYGVHPVTPSVESAPLSTATSSSLDAVPNDGVIEGEKLLSAFQ